MRGGKLLWKSRLVRFHGQKSLRHFYPFAKGRKELNFSGFGVVLQDEFDGDAQKLTAPPNRHFSCFETTFKILQIFKQATQIFKRPKNCEHSSDFDDFLTKLIATSRSSFSKIFASSRFFSRRRKISNERERTNDKVYLRCSGHKMKGF